MYKCKHFIIEELVHEDTLKDYGEEGCWQLFDENLLMAIDGIREYFGMPITINNWHHGGVFSNRGYRDPDCPIGAVKSTHKQGKAADMDIKDIPSEVARRMIILNKDDERLKHIMRMEVDVKWLHVDVKSVTDRIYLFKP